MLEKNQTEQDNALEMTVSYVAGSGSNYDHPEAITEPGLGGKFDPDGNVLPFPGNTFICHIDPVSEFYHAL